MAGRRLAGLDVLEQIGSLGIGARRPASQKTQRDRRSGCVFLLGGLAAAFLAEPIRSRTRRPCDAMESAVAWIWGTLRASYLRGLVLREYMVRPYRIGHFYITTVVRI